MHLTAFLAASRPPPHRSTGASRVLPSIQRVDTERRTGAELMRRSTVAIGASRGEPLPIADSTFHIGVRVTSGRVTSAVAEDDVRLDAGEALLVKTFGIRLLAYLCAVGEAQMVSRLEHGTVLSTAAEAVLGHLVRLAQVVGARLAEHPGLPRHLSIDLVRTVPDAIGLGTALRLSAGGKVPVDLVEGRSDDPVKSAVGRMAIDAFPQLLLPKDRFWPTLPVSVYHHPSREGLQEAITSDGALSRLFTEDDPSIGRHGYMYNSLGRGGSYQDVLFGEMVIASSWETMVMTEPRPEVRGLVEQCYRNVDTLRSALAGEPALVPARVVFTGFRTTELPISTPWGPLRPMTEWERELAPPALQGAVTGGQADGSQVTVSYAGEMLLEAEMPYAVVLSTPPRGEPWPDIAGSGSLRRMIEGTQLSLLLATERPQSSWPTARLAWTWTADPLGHGSNIGWSDTRSGTGFMPAELSATECQSVSEWAHRIDGVWIAKVDVAVRRLLRAANERNDMADRLVDAVIVWENLFGTSEGEPTLRISSSMAWLLGTGSAEREELQRSLRSLYRSRSRIVHGGTLEEATLAQDANAALTYARDALRVLLRERPDLLALSDGSARSVRLIMGG